MNKIITFVLLLLVQLYALAGSNNLLTEHKIKQVMRTIDVSILNKNAEGLEKTLSENVVFRIRHITPCQIQKKTMNKSEFLQGTIEAWGNDEDYMYKRLNSQVAIVDGGAKAISNSLIHESFIANGKIILLTTKETVTYVPNGDSAMATSVSAEVSINACI